MAEDRFAGALRIAHVYEWAADRPVANGVWRVIDELARNQCAMGHDVSVLAPGVTGRLGDWDPGNGARGLRGAARALGRWADANVDVVHVHGAFLFANDLLARRLRRAPYILTPHSSYLRYPLRHRKRALKSVWRVALDRSLFAHARAVHCITVAEARDTSAYLPCDPVVIPNGLDGIAPISDGERSAARTALGIAPDARVVLFIGRLDRLQKGIDRLEAAFEAVRRVRPESRLIIAGPPDPHTPMPPPGDGVTHLPAVFGTEKRGLLCAADIFAHTSRWDVTPTAALEAAMVGLPLLATPEAGLDDVIAISGGRCVTRDGLVESLRECLESSPGANPERGRAVGEHYSTARQAGALDRVLRGVVDSGGGRPWPGLTDESVQPRIRRAEHPR